MAIGVNLLFVVLLVSSRARVTPEPLAVAMMWLVLEQSREPQQRPARERTQRVLPTSRDRALTMGPSAPDASIQLIPPTQVPEDPPAQPPIDWGEESRLVAKRFTENYGKPDSFSPPPGSDLPAKLCAPRVPGAAMQAKMDELIPPPPEPYAGGGWPPAGSVLLAGNVRVQIIQFSVPVGKKSSGHGAGPDVRDKRSKSSVPDPDKCD